MPSTIRHIAHLGLAAVVTVAATAASAAPVQLEAPRDGAILIAGSTAVIAWSWLPERAAVFASPAEEWEAFLSLDGGRSYPIRITPHLDAALTRFSFPVPRVASNDTRLLLRLGDERREVGFEMPQRLAIVLPPHLTPAPVSTLLTSAGRRGEAARPGEPGVAIWVEGTRAGSGLRLCTAAGATAFAPGWRIARTIALPLLPPRPEEVGGTPPRPTRSEPHGHGVGAGLRPLGPAARAAGLLLLLQRRNE